MQSGFINLEQDDPIAIEAFLEFLYTDFVSEERLKATAKELLVVASKYQVSLLSKKVEIYIIIIIYYSFPIIIILSYYYNIITIIPSINNI